MDVDGAFRAGKRRLERNNPFVGNHPRVMARLDYVGVARLSLALGAVLVGHVQPARLNDATCRTWQLSVAMTGFTHSDHFQPGSNV